MREAECGGQACDPEDETRTELCPTVTTCPTETTCFWGAWENWDSWTTEVFDLFRGVPVRF